GLVLNTSDKRKARASSLFRKVDGGLGNRCDLSIPPHRCTAEDITCGLPVVDCEMATSIVNVPFERCFREETDRIGEPLLKMQDKRKIAWIGERQSTAVVRVNSGNKERACVC